jgi:hypothetical protein
LVIFENKNAGGLGKAPELNVSSRRNPELLGGNGKGTNGISTLEKPDYMWIW